MTRLAKTATTALTLLLLAGCGSADKAPDYSKMSAQEIVDVLTEDSKEMLAEAKEVDTQKEADAFVAEMREYANDNKEVGDMLTAKMEAMPAEEQMTFAMSMMGGGMMETSMGLMTEIQRISTEFPSVAEEIAAIEAEMGGGL